MIHRVLIDECLSTKLVSVAKANGVVADHVTWLGKSGIKDWNLIPFAISNDYILVTNNRRDFLRSYKSVELHPGLIIIVPMVERNDQLKLFSLAIEHVNVSCGILNKVIEVFSDGEVRTTEWCSLYGDLEYVTSPLRAP